MPALNPNRDTLATGTSPGWWMRPSAHWRKAAASPGGSDVTFEAAFSNLAHSYIRDKAPKLLDYEIGFQLVDKNEDRTRAIGVLGFKLGEQWLYAPVFFLNGELKGHDLLYIKNQDAFVPMKENWINYLLGRKPVVLGGGTGRNTANLGVLPPDLARLSRSPYKFAGHAGVVPEWALDAMAVMARAALTPPPATEYFARFVTETGRPTVGYLAEKVAAACPDLVLAVEAYYPGLLAKAAAVVPPPPPRPVPAGGLTTYRRDRLSVLAPLLLDEADRLKLAAGREVIADRRVTATAAYRVETPQTLTNPTATGLYDVLVGDGDFAKCLVVKAPVSGGDSPRGHAIVVKLDGKAAVAADPSAVWVTGPPETAEYREWYAALPAGELPTGGGGGGTRLLIGPAGQATALFHVDGTVADLADGKKGYRVHFWDSLTYGTARGPRRPSPALPADPVRYRTSADCVKYLFRSGLGDSVRTHGDTMVVPEAFKALTVSQTDSGEYGDSKALDGLRLGTLIDFHLRLAGGGERVKIRVGDGTVAVDGNSTSKAAAVRTLIGRGLREATAEAVVADAATRPGRTADYLLVKRAAPGDPVGDMAAAAPGAPSFPEPDSEWEPTLAGGVPANVPTRFEVPVADMAASRTDRSVYDPRLPDARALQEAQRAAQSGQKEVFDTAMLGTMLKVVRNDGMVDKYLGDLMKGLDRLGRVLFLYYWHGDAFADRYGKQDMPELEDTLRNAFETLGDVVLTLKKKTIDPMPSGGVDVDLSESAGRS